MSEAEKDTRRVRCEAPTARGLNAKCERESGHDGEHGHRSMGEVMADARRLEQAYVPPDEAKKHAREWTAMDSLRTVRGFLQRHPPTDDKEQGEWLARWLDELEVALTAALEERDRERARVEGFNAEAKRWADRWARVENRALVEVFEERAERAEGALAEALDLIERMVERDSLKVDTEADGREFLHKHGRRPDPEAQP